VRDVVAHLLDTALRRLSFARDHTIPPAPPSLRSETDFVAFINDLNAAWIRAAERLSPRVLTDLYAGASTALADFIESASLESPALFPVSWAGDAGAEAWLDIGREFTEIWHHGSQIRDAVAAGSFSDARWLHAVLEIAFHAVPHAYRDVPGRAGLSLAIVVAGPAGGRWTLGHTGERWEIVEDGDAAPAAQATMSDDVAWRLFFNALSPSAAAGLVEFAGDPTLARPLLQVRSVVV
jgi:mycothiol maleylpyruvate isomerase-like protein